MSQTEKNKKMKRITFTCSGFQMLVYNLIIAMRDEHWGIEMREITKRLEGIGYLRINYYHIRKALVALGVKQISGWYYPYPRTYWRLPMDWKSLARQWFG
jgi:hypothetical protein